MNRNKLLAAVLLISNVFSVVLVLSLFLFSVALIHWHIDREFYSHFPIPVLDLNTLAKFTMVRTVSTGEVARYTDPTLNNISHLSFYFLYLQVALLILLLLRSLNEFKNVIRSVKRVQTFVSGNILLFRKIGFMLLLVCFISGFNVVSYGDTTLYGVYIHTSPLVLALCAFTLSEIFKEGNALLEENRGTI